MCKKAYEVKDVSVKLTGELLKDLRIKHNYKVSQIQDYFGFDYPQAVYNWEQGKKLPNISNLIALAALYNVTVDELLVRAA